MVTGLKPGASGLTGIVEQDYTLSLAGNKSIKESAYHAEF